ncbi:MAG: UDP-N-acetylglucosamine 2-epimerase (non-hydrolyzing), partial [bacterium]
MPGDRFLLVAGTRPEVIKLAPVYFALREVGAEVVIVNTNQQQELTQQALDIFDLQYHHSIRPSDYHSLNERLAHLMIYLQMQYKDYNPDFVIVQG